MYCNCKIFYASDVIMKRDIFLHTFTLTFTCREILMTITFFILFTKFMEKLPKTGKPKLLRRWKLTKDSIVAKITPSQKFLGAHTLRFLFYVSVL